MLANKLTINAAKTNSLVVFPTTKIPPHYISLKCNEVSITIQDSMKYLGSGAETIFGQGGKTEKAKLRFYRRNKRSLKKNKNKKGLQRIWTAFLSQK